MPGVKTSKAANATLIIAFVITLMYIAQTILIPLLIALILAMLIYPVVDLFEQWKIPRIISIIISFIIVIAIIAGIFTFFSTQFVSLFENIQVFEQNIKELINRINSFISENLSNLGINLKDIYKSEKKNILKTSTTIIGSVISSSSSFFAYIGLVFIYTFLFLLYRTSFKQFVLSFYSGEKRKETETVIIQVQKIAQKYFFGLFLIILIVGTLNGIGLWLIGIDYPFLFGYFAALLTIIPYIGTTIGGTLPFLYALIFHESIWMPIGVVLLYTGIQSLEGNLLTPKIVGNQVSLNPFFALLALIIGGFMWGIAGMILFIPLMAIFKVICEHNESLRPFAFLLSSNIYKGSVK